jgi:hypothetical protein
MQIKMTLRFHLIPYRMAAIKKIKELEAWIKCWSTCLASMKL